MLMNEQINNELKKAAGILNIEVSVIEEKWNEICSANNLGDEQSNIALNLFVRVDRRVILSL